MTNKKEIQETTRTTLYLRNTETSSFEFSIIYRTSCVMLHSGVINNNNNKNNTLTLRRRSFSRAVVDRSLVNMSRASFVADSTTQTYAQTDTQTNTCETPRPKPSSKPLFSRQASRQYSPPDQ